MKIVNNDMVEVIAHHPIVGPIYYNDIVEVPINGERMWVCVIEIESDGTLFGVLCNDAKTFHGEMGTLIGGVPVRDVVGKLREGDET